MIPGGLVLLLGTTIFFFVELPPAARSFLPFYPAVVVIAGLLLGWRFNRSRIVFALLLLVMADRALALAPQTLPVATAVLMLVPLNLVWIVLSSERGLFTRRGLARLVLQFGAQPLIVAYYLQDRPAEILAAIHLPLFSWPPPDLLPKTLPHSVLIVLLLAGGILLFRLFVRPNPVEGGFFWFLPVACLPLALGCAGFDLTLGFATAGLILLLALIETSHRMAYKDELTGLPARRALSESLVRLGRRYTVAMVDIDHFKKVNDRFGHDVGDQALKMVAGEVARISGGGQAFRYGGEEFTLLFPGKEMAEALPHLEKLRQAIQAAEFILRHPSRPKNAPKRVPTKRGTQRLQITVSIGVAGRQGEMSAEQVIKAADKALYRAKEEGRNRVCQGPGKKSGSGN
jgi:diguanylate cyclase (GGDEF)-like protein